MHHILGKISSHLLNFTFYANFCLHIFFNDCISFTIFIPNYFGSNKEHFRIFFLFYFLTVKENNISRNRRCKVSVKTKKFRMMRTLYPTTRAQETLQIAGTKQSSEKYSQHFCNSLDYAKFTFRNV